MQNVENFQMVSLYKVLKYDKFKDEVSTTYPWTPHRFYLSFNACIGLFTETYMNISGVWLFAYDISQYTAIYYVRIFSLSVVQEVPDSQDNMRGLLVSRSIGFRQQLCHLFFRSLSNNLCDTSKQNGQSTITFILENILALKLDGTEIRLIFEENYKYKAKISNNTLLSIEKYYKSKSIIVKHFVG